jgi:hypothetical protein
VVGTIVVVTGADYLLYTRHDTYIHSAWWLSNIKQFSSGHLSKYVADSNNIMFTVFYQATIGPMIAAPTIACLICKRPITAAR